MTIWRAHIIDTQTASDSSASDAERVGMLRTSLFLATIGSDDDKNVLRDTQAVSKCDAIITHDAPFLYQALVQRESSMIGTLNKLERWLLSDPQRDFPVTSVSLALWANPAAECLLSDTEASGQAFGRLNLSQLAMLLLCTTYTSHATDTVDHDRSGNLEFESSDQRKKRALARTGYEAGHARRITEHVVRLLPDPHRTNLLRTVTAETSRLKNQDSSEDPWIVGSLIAWGRILEVPSIFGEQPVLVDLRTINMVYAKLLAHISTQTLPIDRSSNLDRILSAFDFLTTSQFAATTWSASALLGPFNGLLRVADHVSAGNGDQIAWKQLSTLLAHLFAYVAKHNALVGRDALAQSMSCIVEIMSKQRTLWGPFSIGTSLIRVVPPLSAGQSALLYVPPNSGQSSIWQSACALRAAAPEFYNTKMFAAATTIARNLSNVGRSQKQQDLVRPLLEQLLEPDGALMMLGEKGGTMLNVHVKWISPEVHTNQLERLSGLPGRVAHSSMAATGGEPEATGTTFTRGEEGEMGPRARRRAQAAQASLAAHSTSFISGSQDSDLESGLPRAQQT